MSADSVSPVRAIVWSILGYSAYSVADAMTKTLTSVYPVTQIVFLNALFSLLPIAAVAVLREGRAGLRIGSPRVHLLRAALGLGAIGLNTFAFTRMPLADAYALLFTAPLVIAGLSTVFLGERTDLGGWITILIGFAAVLVMVRPGTEAGGGRIDIGVAAAAAGVLCFSASALVIRRFGGAETMYAFPFYGNLFVVAVLAPIVGTGFVVPTPAHFALGAVVGVVIGSAQIVVLGAFRAAPPSVVAPFQYSQILWGAVLGWILFGDVPGARTIVGGAVVIAAGLHLMRRETRRGAGPSDRSSGRQAC